MSEPEYQNKPTQVNTYRELTERETALVNRWKALEVEVATLWADTHEAGASRVDLHKAADHLRTAFMWSVRSVTKPRDAFDHALADAISRRVD